MCNSLKCVIFFFFFSCDSGFYWLFSFISNPFTLPLFFRVSNNPNVRPVSLTTDPYTSGCPRDGCPRSEGRMSTTTKVSDLEEKVLRLTETIGYLWNSIINITVNSWNKIVASEKVYYRGVGERPLTSLSHEQLRTPTHLSLNYIFHCESSGGLHRSGRVDMS